MLYFCRFVLVLYRFDVSSFVLVYTKHKGALSIHSQIYECGSKTLANLQLLGKIAYFLGNIIYFLDNITYFLGKIRNLALSVPLKVSLHELQTIFICSVYTSIESRFRVTLELLYNCIIDL